MSILGWLCQGTLDSGGHGLSSARVRLAIRLTLAAAQGPNVLVGSSTGFPKAKVTVVWARSHCVSWTLALCQVAPQGPEAQAWPGMDGPHLPLPPPGPEGLWSLASDEDLQRSRSLTL